jgi:hypothetical protein
MSNFTILCDSGCVALLRVAFFVYVVAHPVVAEVQRCTRDLFQRPSTTPEANHGCSANNEESIAIAFIYLE